MEEVNKRACARDLRESTLGASASLPLVLAPHSKREAVSDGENVRFCAERRKIEGFDTN